MSAGALQGFTDACWERIKGKFLCSSAQQLVCPSLPLPETPGKGERTVSSERSESWDLVYLKPLEQSHQERTRRGMLVSVCVFGEECDLSLGCKQMVANLHFR